LALNLSISIPPVSASPIFAAPLCGDGSAPDYGFSYAQQQAHWTVNWQNYASEQAVAEVDAVLDRLNEDAIAQTMILIQAQAQVGNRVNCAVHFLRYMQLGLPDGERKDNGFVFLIVVEPTRIDVHYSVGLGLPALTASELTTLNRSAEETYLATHSMDQTLVSLVQEFDSVARNKYTPLISPIPASGTTNLPQLPSGPLGILMICGMLCLGGPILFWILIQMARGGLSSFIGMGSRGGMGNLFGGSRGGGNPFGRGEGMGNPFGGGGGSSPTRGGSGSGRSGRGN
jgi:hypothetical protein